MIQYETRLQTPGPSIKLSFLKREVLSGARTTVYSLVGDDLVLKAIKSVSHHGKHDLLFVSIGSSKSIQCRKDTKLMTADRDWVTVEDLAVGDELMGVRTGLQRPRAGERGAFLRQGAVIDALPEPSPVVEIRKSHIMWSGKRNDVMSVKMEDIDNFVTSTGLVVYGG